MILSRILNKVYGLDPLAPNRRGRNLPKLAEELQQWFTALPPLMQLKESNDNTAAPPDVLVLHMQYWYAVLTLYRKLCALFHHI